MRTTTAMTLLAALALAACAGGRAPDVTPPSPASAIPAGGTSHLAPERGVSRTVVTSARTAYGTASAAPDAQAHEPGRAASAGEVAVAVVGTPFFWVIKGTVCAASLVVAAPTSALIAVAGDPYGEGVEILGNGLAQNCGPPYVLTP